jgi:hypothetical protein
MFFARTKASDCPCKEIPAGDLLCGCHCSGVGVSYTWRARREEVWRCFSVCQHLCHAYFFLEWVETEAKVRPRCDRPLLHLIFTASLVRSRSKSSCHMRFRYLRYLVHGLMHFAFSAVWPPSPMLVAPPPSHIHQRAHQQCTRTKLVHRARTETFTTRCASGTGCCLDCSPSSCSP